MVNLNLLALYAQVAVPVFAVLAILVTTVTAIADRRRADSRMRQLLADLMAAEERRFERELLIRLSTSLESGNERVPDAKAAILALGPSRLPQACQLLLGPVDKQEQAINQGDQLEKAWDRARAEVARALRQGLPARGNLPLAKVGGTSGDSTVEDSTPELGKNDKKPKDGEK